MLLIPSAEKVGDSNELLEGVTFSLLEGFAITQDGRLSPADSITANVLDSSF
jgi:hypothetical protein